MEISKTCQHPQLATLLDVSDHRRYIFRMDWAGNVQNAFFLVQDTEFLVQKVKWESRKRTKKKESPRFLCSSLVTKVNLRHSKTKSLRRAL